MTGSLQILGTQTGLSSGSKTIGPIQITLSETDYTTQLPVETSDFEVPIPESAVGVLIIPAAAQYSKMTFVGTAGDVGFELSSTWPSLLCFPVPPPESFGLDVLLDPKDIDLVIQLVFF
jgi:hypothetical protein